jgi:WhiB family transcriptional regulator, redox-sensing transcriptional regulator
MNLGEHDQPACLDLDPESFFPDPTPGRSHFNGEQGQELVYSTIVALSTCARCPMQSKCLQFAIDMREAYGIWGGTFPHERDKAIGLPQGQPTSFSYYSKLRAAVLSKKASLVCPPIPKPVKEFIPIAEFLSVPQSPRSSSLSASQQEESWSLE